MSRKQILNHIRVHRDLKGWSQAELAAKAGLSRSEISAIEIGRLVPSVMSALQLAKALGCDVEKLFASSNESEATAAWPGSSNRFWLASVNGNMMRYHEEMLPIGIIPTDEGQLGRAIQEAQNTLVIAGCDPAVGLLTGELANNGIRCLPFTRTSRQSLNLLKQGLVHVAGFHLGTSAEHNIAAAREVLGDGFQMIRVTTWEEGLAFSSGKTALLPLDSDRLQKLKWVGREQGSGARACSDELLGEMERVPVGYNSMARNHRGVAETLATGWAQVGVCVRLIAEDVGLAFKTVRHESYDFCFRTSDENDPRIQLMIRQLQSSLLRRSLSSLVGYDARQCGERVLL